MSAYLWARAATGNNGNWSGRDGMYDSATIRYLLLVVGVMASILLVCIVGTNLSEQRKALRYDHIQRVMQNSRDGTSLTLWVRQSDGSIVPIEQQWKKVVAHDDVPADKDMYAIRDRETDRLDLHLHSAAAILGGSYTVKGGSVTISPVE